MFWQADCSVEGYEVLRRGGGCLKMARVDSIITKRWSMKKDTLYTKRKLLVSILDQEFFNGLRFKVSISLKIDFHTS